MCLALPARVIEIHDDQRAVVELGGVRKTISLALVDDIQPGDYVIVHVGYALTRLDQDQAQATLALMATADASAETLAFEVHRRIPRRRTGATRGQGHRYGVRLRARIPLHGILRWPHPRHRALRPARPAAAQRAHDPRPRMPGRVLPIGRIDMAISLALEHGAIVCTYADTLRVPASGDLSLMRARARGGDIRMVYAVDDALRIARENPHRDVVFFAIGFETTTPPTAAAVLQAEAEALANFSVLCCHVLTPAAIAAILDAGPEEAPDGPAHVSVVIGSDPYAEFARSRHKPVVIAGFEPLDVMQAILMLLRQVNEGRAEVENEFIRAVTPSGNRKAQAMMAQVFEVRDRFEWRGLGEIPLSALQLRDRYAHFDAERRFPLGYRSITDNRACDSAPSCAASSSPSTASCSATFARRRRRWVRAWCPPRVPARRTHYTYGRHKDVQRGAA